MRKPILILLIGLIVSAFVMMFYINYGKFGLFAAGGMILAFVLALAKHNYLSGPQNPYEKGSKEYEVYGLEKAKLRAQQDHEIKQRRNEGPLQTGFEIENSFFAWDAKQGELRREIADNIEARRQETRDEIEGGYMI